MQKEYIEREAVLRIIDKYGCGNGSVLGYHSGAVDCAGSEIARIPAADVVEVRHAKWVSSEQYNGRPECPVCFCVTDEKTNYCPYCGCKMDKEE